MYSSAVSDLTYSASEFLPALIEKCRMNLNVQDFDQLEEAIDELLRVDRNSIHGYQYRAFYDLVREGNLDNGQDNFNRLVALIKESEPHNLQLMLFSSQLFSRISGRSTQIINNCILLLQNCRKIDPLQSGVILELANCYYMIGNHKKALKIYKEAASIDIDSIDPTIGILKCLIAQNKLREAASQLEFLSELSSSLGGETPDVSFLEGMLHARKHGEKGNFQQMEENLNASNKALGNALTLHIRQQKTIPQNLEFYVKLNPDFLISLANELMYHADFNLSQIKNRIQNPTSPTHLIKKAAKLLDTTIKKVPGLIPAYMLSAKAKLIIGDMNGAIQSLQKSLDFDPKNEEAHILSAIIVYSNGNLDSAYASVKEALSNNFDLDKNPFFMLVKGQIEFEMKDTEEGLKTLKKAYELPGVQDDAEVEAGHQNRFMTVVQFNDNIRAQIFVYYAKALAETQQPAKAKEVIESAILEFAGTDDEPVVLLGNADMAILSGDLKKAISILKNVEPTANGYMDARKKLASIYLNNMKQRRQYAKCYQDLADNFPTIEILKLYGDSLMSIQEAKQAITVYKKAQELDPQNHHIVRQIGQAMAITHNYQAATDYYEQVIEEFPNNINIKLDYGKLLLKTSSIEVS